MKEISAFLIAAPHSASGKTTVALGLMRALKKRGYAVQPFKCGPDYIDTRYHEAASGNPSVNLDLFLASGEHLQNLYARYALHSDVCLAEGMMGLFDGYDKQKGSSAAIAALLDLPVVLVVNARSAAYSAAPLLYGFKHFDKSVRVAGVIFNFVASEGHYGFLRQACADAGLRSFGYLPADAGLEIPSRHLGLSLDRAYLFGAFADNAASVVEKYLDVEGLVAATRTSVDGPFRQESGTVRPKIQSAVARDDAFCFMYRENIEYLKRRGGVAFFSPLNDTRLPDADFVYLPGGYPELFLEQLSRNNVLQRSIREYVERGGHLLAECGGMMYLSASITDRDGAEFPMAGVFPQKTSMQGMKLTLGYRRFEYNGLSVKGHEFHYSRAEGGAESVVQQYNARNVPVDTKLWRCKNALAGYTHLYWAEMDHLPDLFK